MLLKLELQQKLESRPELQLLQTLVPSFNPFFSFTPWEQGKRELEDGCFHFKQLPGAE